ncbi:MAG TPA: fumarylacetoacetate hydrolase family protein [Candidatus Nanopelagicales bacterium]|nr:fumarylacetoacetate hydrolase family protein [Candidatus Nanopelagicales bacterium]
MRIARYSGPDGSVGFGVVDGVGPDGETDASSSITPIVGHPYGPLEIAGSPFALADVRLLAPVLPSKIVAVGRNYAAHAKELGNEVPSEPMIFLKPSTSVIGPGDAIALPLQSEQVEHEAELAVVIGRLCSEVPIRRVPDVVLGYTCANDVSARDLQASDGQWGRAKGFDTFCPLGPWIETELDASSVAVRCTVNGEVRQDGTTADMVRGVDELVAWISNVMTLLPGDVILTGTPAGVGPIVDGDSVSISISSLGTLTNRAVTRD